MNRFISVVLASVAAILAVGCGGGGKDLGIEGGDQMVVTARLERERVNTVFGESVKNADTDGAFVEIPEGTVLEVFVTPKVGANKVEFVPKKATVEVPPAEEGGAVTTRETTNPDELREKFVPTPLRRDDLIHYTFSLDTSYLGGKLRKLDTKIE